MAAEALSHAIDSDECLPAICFNNDGSNVTGDPLDFDDGAEPPEPGPDGEEPDNSEAPSDAGEGSDSQ